jgi:hypothetical protein
LRCRDYPSVCFLSISRGKCTHRITCMQFYRAGSGRESARRLAALSPAPGTSSEFCPGSLEAYAANNQRRAPCISAPRLPRSPANSTPRMVQRMFKPPFWLVFRPVVPFIFIPFMDHNMVTPNSLQGPVGYISGQAREFELPPEPAISRNDLEFIKEGSQTGLLVTRYTAKPNIFIIPPAAGQPRTPANPAVTKFLLATPAVSKDTEGLRRTCWKEMAVKAPL